jgi:ribosomal protein S20
VQHGRRAGHHPADDREGRQLDEQGRHRAAAEGAQGHEQEGPHQLGPSGPGGQLRESRAYIAAANLVGTIDALVVNRAFIQQKTARIQSQAKATKLDEATNKDLQDIIKDVMNSYNNGDFAAANKRLNQAAATIAKQ